MLECNSFQIPLYRQDNRPGHYVRLYSIVHFYSLMAKAVTTHLMQITSQPENGKRKIYIPFFATTKYFILSSRQLHFDGFCCGRKFVWRIRYELISRKYRITGLLNVLQVLFVNCRIMFMDPYLHTLSLPRRWPHRYNWIDFQSVRPVVLERCLFRVLATFECQHEPSLIKMPKVDGDDSLLGMGSASWLNAAQSLIQ